MSAIDLPVVADDIEPTKHAGRFQLGNTFSQGRKRGSLNRSSAELKSAIIAALDEAGGVQWLKSLAASPDPEDKKLFVALLIKCLPSQTSFAESSDQERTFVSWLSSPN
jgi:hypothetical protein